MELNSGVKVLIDVVEMREKQGRTLPDSTPTNRKRWGRVRLGAEGECTDGTGAGLSDGCKEECTDGVVLGANWVQTRQKQYKIRVPFFAMGSRSGSTRP